MEIFVCCFKLKRHFNQRLQFLAQNNQSPTRRAAPSSVPSSAGSLPVPESQQSNPGIRIPSGISSSWVGTPAAPPAGSATPWRASETWSWAAERKRRRGRDEEDHPPEETRHRKWCHSVVQSVILPIGLIRPLLTKTCPCRISGHVCKIFAVLR